MLTNIILFLVLLAAILVLITMVTNLLLMVPYVPTPNRVIEKMLSMANLQGDETVYDLGCGDARMLTIAKKQYPNIRAIGYELSPGVWMLAKLRVLFSKQNVELHMRDFFMADMRDADVFLLYLIPTVMAKLEKKLNEEAKPGTRVISHGFQFKDKEPVTVERCALPAWHFLKPKKYKGPRIFVYEW